MTRIGQIFADFFDFIRAHPPDLRYQRRVKRSLSHARAQKAGFAADDADWADFRGFF